MNSFFLQDIRNRIRNISRKILKLWNRSTAELTLKLTLMKVPFVLTLKAISMVMQNHKQNTHQVTMYYS